MPPNLRPAVRPVVLVILDGFGCREPTPDNAIAQAVKPNWDRLLATCPHTSIDASELAVGLPHPGLALLHDPGMLGARRGRRR